MHFKVCWEYFKVNGEFFEADEEYIGGLLQTLHLRVFGAYLLYYRVFCEYFMVCWEYFL